MERVKDFLIQFWIPILAFVVFGVAVMQYVQTGRWERDLIPMMIAAYGFVCVLAPDEVSDWTGWYGWTHQQYRNTPASIVRLFGAVGLTIATIVLFYR